MRRTDRNSSCAAIQSGTYSSASGWPLATRSSVARTCSRSTKPVARACTTTWSRSFQAMLPTAATCGDSVPSTTGAVRTPRFCWMRGLTVTLLPSPSLSAYTGTSIMSMNGDLAGLSNLFPGTIGSW